ncbi:unnamed protein product [Lota lota]
MTSDPSVILEREGLNCLSSEMVTLDNNGGLSVWRTPCLMDRHLLLFLQEEEQRLEAPPLVPAGGGTAARGTSSCSCRRRWFCRQTGAAGRDGMFVCYTDGEHSWCVIQLVCYTDGEHSWCVIQTVNTVGVLYRR